MLTRGATGRHSHGGRRRLRVRHVIVSVHTDISRFQATLTDLQQKQLPFATALALNQTTRLAVQNLTRALPEIFSKKGEPTPFTRRAIGMTGARKTNLRAAIFVKRQQAKYLGIEETGGDVSRAPGQPILTPVDADAELNAYRNLPRGFIRHVLSNPRRYFMGTVRGVYGVWERTGSPGPRGGEARGLRLLVALRARAHYKPKFGFHDHVEASVRANFLPALSAGLARAMATARKL